MANLRGGSMTAVIRTAPTGSTLSRGRTSSSTVHENGTADCGTVRNHSGRADPGGSARRPDGRELSTGARPAARECEARASRHLFRRRCHYATLGSYRLPGVAGELEPEFLWMEC